jgi:hypothetical protein
VVDTEVCMKQRKDDCESGSDSATDADFLFFHILTSTERDQRRAVLRGVRYAGCDGVWGPNFPSQHRNQAAAVRDHWVFMLGVAAVFVMH